MVPAAVTRTLDSFKAGVDAYDVAALDGCARNGAPPG